VKITVDIFPQDYEKQRALAKMQLLEEKKEEKKQKLRYGICIITTDKLSFSGNICLNNFSP
jgi:hypothetical protein